MDNLVQSKNRFRPPGRPACHRRAFLFNLAGRVARAVVMLATPVILTSLSAGAQGVPHLTITQPGGMPGLPVMTGIQQATNSVNVTWEGPSGYYQVWQKVHLTDATWLAVGRQTNWTGPPPSRRFTAAIFFAFPVLRQFMPVRRFARTVMAALRRRGC